MTLVWAKSSSLCLCCRGVSVREEGGFCEGNKNLLDFVPRTSWRCTLIFSFFFLIQDLGVVERLVSNLRLTFASHLGLDIRSAVSSCSRCGWCLRAQNFQNNKIYWLLLLRASWDWIRWFCTQDLGGVGGEFLTSFQSS
jgi:hypothetical protein